MHCGKKVRRQLLKSAGIEFTCGKCEKLESMKAGQATAQQDKETERQHADLNDITLPNLAASNATESTFYTTQVGKSASQTRANRADPRLADIISMI